VIARRLTLGIVAVTALASLIAVALANHSQLADPNDTRGLLDVRRVEVKGKMRRPHWKVLTFNMWRPVQIFDSGFAIVHLDTFGGPRFDYFALVRSNGRKLLASLWRDRKTKRDFKMGRLMVWRPTKSSFSVRVPLGKMRIGKRRIAYEWSLETLFTSDACRKVCIDFVPDEGRVTEPLPAPTPSVTATPDPTETPSPTPSE